MIARDLNISLERYARSYHVHGEQVDTRALIPEIVRAFLDADREFQSWSRTAGDPPRRAVIPASCNGSAKTQPVTCLNEVPADVNGMDPASLWGTASMNGRGWYVDHHHSKARRVRR